MPNPSKKLPHRRLRDLSTPSIREYENTGVREYENMGIRALIPELPNSYRLILFLKANTKNPGGAMIMVGRVDSNGLGVPFMLCTI